MEKKIIIASHGLLAQGMKNTVEMIVGEPKYPVQALELKFGQHPDDLVKQIESEISANQSIEYDIVVDLYGASVSTAMFKLTKYPNVKLFSGMNLNLILSLLLEHDEALDLENIEQILSDAKSGIKHLEFIVEDINEDF